MHRHYRQLTILAALALLVIQATTPRQLFASQDINSIKTIQVSISTERDSLLAEIRSYSHLISTMRDSLALEEMGLVLDDEQKERIQESIGQVSEVVQNITRELGRLDLQIKNNQISLLNESGEGIVINIPENLDSHISEGLNAVSKIILSELPDSLHVDRNWNWTGLTHSQRKPRRVINGNVVKIGDDVLVSADEVVRGDVVVIMGNAEIAGHVQGDVVVILGDLQVGESAEIEGHTVTVGGSLDQDPEAQVGEMTVIDPLPGGGLELGNLLTHGWLPFVLGQGLFLVVLMLAGLATIMTPTVRFQKITDFLKSHPLDSLGVGVLVTIVGHLLLGLLGFILVLTVIGLPLALLLGLGAGLVSILAVAVAGAVVGDGLCRGLGRQCPSALVAVLIGMCILHFPSFLGTLLAMALSSDVPLIVLGILGILIKILAYFFGLGALLRSRLGA